MVRLSYRFFIRDAYQDSSPAAQNDDGAGREARNAV